MVSGSDELPDLGLPGLPAPWFIYCLLGAGVTLCCISCIGHIAAEAINGCCLCFYSVLMTTLLLLEGILVAFIALDRNWEKVVPNDPTGELESLKHFIKENAEICKWVGVALLATQASSLLLAFILRALVTTQKDTEDNFGDERGGNREPLLSTQPSQPSAFSKGEAGSTLSEIWAARMRKKYGLHGGNSDYKANQNPTTKAIS